MVRTLKSMHCLGLTVSSQVKQKNISGPIQVILLEFWSYLGHRRSHTHIEPFLKVSVVLFIVDYLGRENRCSLV